MNKNLKSPTRGKSTRSSLSQDPMRLVTAANRRDNNMSIGFLHKRRRKVTGKRRTEVYLVVYRPSTGTSYNVRVTLPIQAL